MNHHGPGLKFLEKAMSAPNSIPRAVTLLLSTVTFLTCAAAAGDGTVALDTRLERLVGRLEALCEEEHIPGLAVAIVQDDEVVLARGIGLADIESRRPATAETVFPICSTTKAFTATLIGMLVDDGVMSWDDPVARHLPYFTPAVAGGDPGAEILIRDLLCHRTGFGRMSVLVAGGKASRETILRTAADAQPEAAFRERWCYSNVMYLAAGEAAGAAAGSTWDALVAERILGPLRMTASSTSIRRCSDDEHLAAGYEWESDRRAFRRLEPRNVDNIGPAGSINSTAGDMANWLRTQLGRGAFEGRRLISESAHGETWRRHVDVGGGVGYGFGWMLRDWQGQLLLDHSGGIDGFTAHVALLPAANLGLVLLANVGGTTALQDSVGMVFEAILDDGAAARAPEAPIDLRPYAGGYIANFGSFRDTELEVAVEDDHLVLDLAGRTAIDLAPPDAGGWWNSTMSDALGVRFLRDEAGRIVAMSFRRGDMVYELPRTGVEIVPEVPLRDLQRYLGRYRSDEDRATVIMVIKNNCLALEIPGQKTYELRAPNEQGRWRFRACDRFGVSFEEDGAGAIESVTYHGVSDESTYRRVADLGETSTADEIANLRRTGDRRAALAEVWPFRLSGSVHFPQAGLSGKICWTSAGPDRHVQEMDLGQFGRARTAVDGAVGWTESPHGRIDECRGAALEAARREDVAAVCGDWREYYAEALLLHDDELDGRDVHVILLKGHEAPDVTVRVDAETGDVLRAETVVVRGPARVLTTTLYADYRDVFGLRLPFRIVKANEMTGRAEFRFESFERNIDLDDALFSAPAVERR